MTGGRVCSNYLFLFKDLRFKDKEKNDGRGREEETRWRERGQRGEEGTRKKNNRIIVQTCIVGGSVTFLNFPSDLTWKTGFRLIFESSSWQLKGRGLICGDTVQTTSWLFIYLLCSGTTQKRSLDTRTKVWCIWNTDQFRLGAWADIHPARDLRF